MSTPPEKPTRRRRTKQRRKERSRLRYFSRIGKWTLLVATTLLVAFAISIVFIYPTRSGPGAGRDVELVVPGDESATALAARLSAAGLIASPRIFAVYLRVTGATAGVAPGTHLLTDDLGPGEIVRRLERTGAAARVRVTVPEGWTRFDIARRLQALHVSTQRSFLDASVDPALLTELHIDTSAEGFLFPATYDFPADSDAKVVIRRMKEEFDRRFAMIEADHRLVLTELTNSFGWGMHDIVTLASMIEKEAAVDDERPVIASVFLNRLRDPSFKRKVLQCDPTAGYGCVAMRDQIPACAGYTGKITHDINFDPANTYSTYTHEKLPPGPISNPGAKSLAAVLSPASTRYFYFVARGGGRHTFSETYEGHAAAVKGQ